MDPITIQRIVVAEQREREAKAALYRGGRTVPTRAHGPSTARRLVLALGSLGAVSLMVAQLVG